MRRNTLLTHQVSLDLGLDFNLDLLSLTSPLKLKMKASRQLEFEM